MLARSSATSKANGGDEIEQGICASDPSDTQNAPRAWGLGPHGGPAIWAPGRRGPQIVWESGGQLPNCRAYLGTSAP
eukprot:3061126-Alexandrium_andersonii.AAC.1